jgi:uncharacterized protein YndB with AHSA1/START domain
MSDAQADTAGMAAMSEQSVEARTGKGWDHWFGILDAFGRERLHKERATHLRRDHGLDPWWSQAVTIEYEKSRGLWEPNQLSSGRFQVTVSRTVEVPAERAFRAFAEASELDRWFSHGTEQDFSVGGRFRNGDGDAGEFRAIVPNRRVRFTWEQKQHQPGSWVEVRFAPKGEGRCVVTLRHSNLASRAEVEDLRVGWSWALDSLRSHLHTGKGIKYDDWVAAKRK